VTRSVSALSLCDPSYHELDIMGFSPLRSAPTLAAFFILLTAGMTAAAERPPNVVLFLVDDMGWMDSTPYGSTYYDTPAMRRLASEGMRFTRAYAQPLCSPTRASLLTGTSPARHGIIVPNGHLRPVQRSLPKAAPASQPFLLPTSQSYLDPAWSTLAEVLRDAGYRTAHIGKWHLGLTEPHWPEHQGFDVTFHAEPSPGPPGRYFSPYGVLPVDAPGNEKSRYRGTITDGPPGEYITDRLTAEAIRFIEENRQRPFFLNLWQFGVHGPWGHKESITAEMATRADPTGRQDNPVMASMLKSVDESLGRLLDTLERLDLAKDTILIFTSDNGGNTHSMTRSDAKNERRGAAADETVTSYRRWAGYKPPTNNTPLRDGKASIYEGGVRVPLIVRWPGRVRPGSESDAIVGCVDVFPTVLDLTGVPRPAAQPCDGISWRPVLEERGGLDRDAYVIWYPTSRGGNAVYRDQWKLIRRYAPQPEQPQVMHELYDLESDLGETRNLAPAMPEMVRQLETFIDRLVADTAALAPQPNPAHQPADPTAGLVPRSCTLSLTDSGLRMEATGSRPFLGTAQVKFPGPLTLSLSARSRVGGPGRLAWKLEGQEDFPADGQSTAFVLPPGAAWHDVIVPLPIVGRPVVLRLYLPAETAPVDLREIRFAAGEQSRSWRFDAPAEAQP
jgi:arylsulfatase A-like enzyme